MRINPARFQTSAITLTLLSLVTITVLASKEDALSRIENYKQWQTVIPEPLTITFDIDSIGGWTLADAGPVGDRSFNVPTIRSSNGKTKISLGDGLPEEAPKPKNTKDHVQHGVIYANEQAHKALNSKAAVFPTGSIFVREKISPSTLKPELLAVMIKRERGFNPKGGDWQFLLTDGERRKVKLDQQKGECLDCHSKKKENDFVYPVFKIVLSN